MVWFCEVLIRDDVDGGVIPRTCYCMVLGFVHCDVNVGSWFDALLVLCFCDLSAKHCPRGTTFFSPAKGWKRRLPPTSLFLWRGCLWKTFFRDVSEVGIRLSDACSMCVPLMTVKGQASPWALFVSPFPLLSTMFQEKPAAPSAAWSRIHTAIAVIVNNESSASTSYHNLSKRPRIVGRDLLVTWYPCL
jgi:hypothetical protein